MGQTAHDRATHQRAHFLPFAGVALLCLATVALPPHPDDWWSVRSAAALTGLIVCVGLRAPWHRLPHWAYALPPIGYFAVIALLRDAQGGATSGYATLAILPVVWIALNNGRREVVVGVLAGSLVFVVPILVAGGTEYPPSEWRRALTFAGVAAIVGLGVQALVTERSRQAAAAEARARALAASEATLEAVLLATRRIGSAADPRREICDAAVEIGQAAFAVVAEPDEAGRLVPTAASGLDLSTVVSAARPWPACARCFETGRRTYVADTRADADDADPLVALGAGTLVYEPVLREERALGVLCLGWHEPRAALEGRVTQGLALLAAEAAHAVERADLLARLALLARTDDLTGLPNRRAWEAELPHALARAGRGGGRVTVVLLDLDRFKPHNDAYGHQAGDVLLRRVAQAWQETLRTGDVLARYGGDEFAALLPDTGLDGALAAVERLRAVMPEGTTVSAGTAEWVVGESAAALVGRADAALYRAKARGRDRSEVADAPDPVPTRR